MKNGYFAGLAVLAALFALTLGSCAHADRRAPVLAAGDAVYYDGPFYHNSRNSLTWWGVYEGIVPSASCCGINVRITLNRDYTFELRYEYLGADAVFTVTGTFRWDDAGRNITLEKDGLPLRYPPFYQVGENFLRQLDMQGNPVVGTLADFYILQKTIP